jgi:anti-sigma B factor antagonist
MNVSGEWLGDVLVVHIAGTIREGLDTREFDDRVMSAATPAMERGNAVVFDLSKVDYINSVGLRTLLRVLKASRPGTRFAVVSPQHGAAREQYDISRFDKVIPTYSTGDQAIASVMSPPVRVS